MEKKTFTAQEIADYLGVHLDTIYTMVKQNQIPHFKVRRRILFDLKAIENWKNSNLIANYDGELNQSVIYENSKINDQNEDIKNWIKFADFLKSKGYSLTDIEVLVKNIINTLKKDR